MAEKAKVTVVDKLKDEVKISEALLVGLFWSNPENYSVYSSEKIGKSTFLNDVYGFYFGLGRYIYDKGIKVFDDISVERFCSETGGNTLAKFNRYGGYETMQELMTEVKLLAGNFEAYYKDVQKYATIKNLVELLGNKVVKEDGKYNHKALTREQIVKYWGDKFNCLALNSDNRYEEFDLLDGLEEEIASWDDNPMIGLDFFNSPLFTKISTGWDLSNLYILGGFGGSGKTSFTVAKVFMSCIENQEQLMVLANEQGIRAFRQSLIITALGILYYQIKDKEERKKYFFDRKRLNQGGFNEHEKALLKKAKDWVLQLCQGETALIKFVFMQDYVMDDVKSIVRYYANRGYKRVIIDTGKPSEGGEATKQRWEQFTDDFKELYKLCRKEAGGLNLAMWVTVQLADNAVKYRYLNELCLGESKKVKNEADCLFMYRYAWEDEYDGGDNELKVTRWFKIDPNTENPIEQAMLESGENFYEKEVKLRRGRTYVLLFTPKNRRGMDNKNGGKILVFEINLNFNRWKEIGWTVVKEDRGYY